MRAPAAICAGAAVLAIVLAGAAAASSGNDVQSDAQLRAMRDELARSKTLRLNNLDQPYFIQYSVGDAEELSIQASLGGLISSDKTHFRGPTIAVRVGDYKFDNTNSIYSGTGRVGAFPLDDDYLAIRTAFWLSSDTLYKMATDQITRKRNALREISEPETMPDFDAAKPVQSIQPVTKFKLDEKKWDTTARELSARFALHPSVLSSSVSIRLITSMYRVMNTEGTVIRIPEDLSEVQIRAAATAPDGNRVWDHRFITALAPAQFPSESDMAKAVDAIAAETEALAKAPLADNYSGPVLFEQESAAQLIAQVIANAARLQRKPVAPQGAAPHMIENEWSSKLGTRVAPAWLNIWDDPSVRKYDGRELAGTYEVDDEGVPAERVPLVDKGILKSFLLSREPVGDFRTSNGHGRLPGPFGSQAAAAGNVFVKSDRAVPESKMKAQLLEKVKADGLKYGFLIRRFDFPSTASIEELQSMFRQLQKNGYSRSLNQPLLAYRVYPDGREELVRGARLGEFSARNLRDVVAASDHEYVLNYVNNGTAVNHADARSDATTSSVICPSLLVENVDVVRAENEVSKPPIVPPPALTAP